MEDPSSGAVGQLELRFVTYSVHIDANMREMFEK